jgi:ATP-dependent DNA helicase RecG
MKEGFSKIRNRSLANAFAYMNLVEAWGSGIPKLMQAMEGVWAAGTRIY